MNPLSRYRTPQERQRAVVRVERFARLMDSAFVIPGTKVRAGYDSVIGLVPVLGDVVAALMATFVVYHAWKLRIRTIALAQMIGWVLLDLLVGEVPIAGDVADFFIRSNKMNVAILRRELALQRAAGWDAPDAYGEARSSRPLLESREARPTLPSGPGSTDTPEQPGAEHSAPERPAS